jgi:hypothetical protein
MVGGAVASAVGAYLVQVIGGRALGAEAFAPVSVVWVMLFLGVTVFLIPVEQMVVRRVAIAGGRAGSVRDSLGAIVSVVVAVTVLAAVVALLLRRSLLADDIGYVVVIAAMFPSYGVHVVGRGVLAGRGQFGRYGLVIAGDACAKVIGTALVVILGGGGVALGWVLALSPLVIVLARPFRSAPAENAIPLDPGSDRRFLGGYLVAGAASQVILASGPLVLGALGASAASISVYFVTTTLFRGPLSVSYNLLARVLPSVVRRSATDDAALGTFIARTAVVGVAGAVAAGGLAVAAGPVVVAFLFGAEFRPPASVAGLAAAAVVLGLGALVVSQVLVARGHTGRLASVWLVALAGAAVGVIVSGGDPMMRVAVGFLVGEALALGGLSLAGRRPPSPPGG